MKNIAILAAAAAVMMSSSAFAAAQPIEVNGKVVAQCAVSAVKNSVIVSNALNDANGFARTNIATDVATALDTAGVKAWCSGSANTIILTRTAFVKTGTAGTADLFDFATGAIYDVGVLISGAVRSGFGELDALESTSDGNVGPTNVSSFGPNGLGAVVSFVAQTGTTSGAIETNAGVGSTPAFSVNNGQRLAAGDYMSTVTLTLSPTT